MSLYTGKGDDGTTTDFSCNQRMTKSSAISEALGTVDELNSYLGLLKLECRKEKLSFLEQDFYDVLSKVQGRLFIVQAELAGAKGYSISEQKVKETSDFIDSIDNELPPIKSFMVPGASEISASFDFARTIARRAERRVIAVVDEGKVSVGNGTKAYLNRLSSLLYAMARLHNHLSGIKEESPTYE